MTPRMTPSSLYSGVKGMPMRSLLAIFFASALLAALTGCLPDLGSGGGYVNTRSAGTTGGGTWGPSTLVPGHTVAPPPWLRYPSDTLGGGPTG